MNNDTPLREWKINCFKSCRNKLLHQCWAHKQETCHIISVCPIYKYALLGVPATCLLYIAQNKNIIPASQVVF